MLHLAPSTLTRFVEKLQIKGYVRVESEGRTNFVYLTDEGRALSGVVQDSWDQLHDSYFAILGEEHGDQLALELSQAADVLKEE